jgi:hypothetical protein
VFETAVIVLGLVSHFEMISRVHHRLIFLLETSFLASLIVLLLVSAAMIGKTDRLLGVVGIITCVLVNFARGF